MDAFIKITCVSYEICKKNFLNSLHVLRKISIFAVINNYIKSTIYEKF